MNISAPAPGTFRIASYNVKNLFDDIDDPDKADEDTPAKPAVEQKALAAVIDSSEADVLALQEVENIEALTEFRDKYGLAKEYPHLVLIEGNDRRGIDVAFMSRHPISNVKSHKDEVFEIPGQEPRGFLRDLLQADIEIPKYGPVRFFGAHLASKIGGDRSDVMREAEATAARAIIKEEVKDFPGQRYVVMGDFNDTPDSKSVRILLDEDSDGWALQDGFREEPEAVSYPTSEKTARKWGYKRIDQILLSPEMASTQVDQDVHKHPQDKVASDHWMVTADFKLQSA